MKLVRHMELRQFVMEPHSTQSTFSQANRLGPTHCQLFGWFGWFVQIMLGALSFAVLIYKRHKEHPKRPWKIWFLDTSKQGVSQLTAHFLNVAISLKLSDKQSTHQCLWYFATVMLDTTLGMLICVGLLRLLETTLLRGSLSKYQSGNYYEVAMIKDSSTPTSNIYNSPPKTPYLVRTARRQTITYRLFLFRINYKTYFVQLLIWNAIVLCMKSVLFAIQDKFSKPIIILIEFLMGWLNNFPKLQLVLVMFLIPLTMNALAFWIQDNYLMKKQPEYTDQSSDESECKP